MQMVAAAAFDAKAYLLAKSLVLNAASNRLRQLGRIEPVALAILDEGNAQPAKGALEEAGRVTAVAENVHGLRPLDHHLFGLEAALGEDRPVRLFAFGSVSPRRFDLLCLRRRAEIEFALRAAAEALVLPAMQHRPEKGGAHLAVLFGEGDRDAGLLTDHVRLADNDLDDDPIDRVVLPVDGEAAYD